MGELPPTAWGAAQFTRLVDKRYMDGRRLMVTAKYKSAEDMAAGMIGGLLDKYSQGWGPGVASRLFDSRRGTVRVVLCGAENYRRAKA